MTRFFCFMENGKKIGFVNSFLKRCVFRRRTGGIRPLIFVYIGNCNKSAAYANA